MSLTFRPVRLVVSVVLSVGGLLVSCVVGVPANAQKNIYVESEQEREIARAQIYDFDVGGVKYRIPGSYMRATPEDGRLIIGTYPHALRWLQFNFWISDSMAEKAPLRRGDDHRGRFWPPDPGRPNLSGEDFTVQVISAHPREVTEGLEALRGLRGSGPRTPNRLDRIESYGSLDCGTDTHNPIPTVCENPFDEDPVVYISGGPNPMFPGNYQDLFMYFYSRVDNLEVEVAFPDLGLSRWKEVICRTLSLVWQWRVSDGPEPDRCSQIGHLSMLQDKTIRVPHG